MPTFWLTRFRVVLVISWPCWPAFVFLSPFESPPFEDNFQHGPLGEEFFFKGS